MSNILLFIFSILFGGIFAYKPILCVVNSKNKSREFKKYKKEFITSAIIMVGCLIRTLFLDLFPSGLNQDEASIGYEAFCLAYYGIDRNGLSYPVHFIAWGSGQNALYAYLAIPFIKILGLSVFSLRLPMALIGCGSIYVFYFLVKQLLPKHTLLGTFLFAINPWHIEKSRWALESNLFPDIFLLGILLLVLAINGKKYCYILAGVVFGLATYAYGTSYFILPVFCMITLIILLVKKQISIANSVIFIGTIFIVSLPMIIFVLLNYSSADSISILGMTIPKLFQNRQTFILNLDGAFLSGIWENFKTAVEIVFIQHDGLVWSGMPFYGTIYVVLTPFFLFGVYKAIRVKNHLETPVLAWLFTSLFMLLFIEANINRANILFIPMIYFVLRGIVPFLEKESLGDFPKIAVAICLSMLFIGFAGSYFGREHQESLDFQFFNGAGDAMALASERYESVYVTDNINMPYIAYLFYMQVSPYEYLETREVINPYDSFEYISKVNNFYFYDINLSDLQTGECYIAFSSIESEINTEIYNIEYFGEFIIISKK